MKLLIFSDSHGYTQNMIHAIQKVPDADMVIHLGDMLRDVEKVSRYFKQLSFEFVRGNNDYNTHIPLEKILEVEGKKIFITHGHQYQVKLGFQNLIARGVELSADAVLFGHTHCREEFYTDHLLVLNPGSISVPARIEPFPSYCILEINDNKIRTQFFNITL